LTALLLVLILGAGIEILYGDSATFGRTLQPEPPETANSPEEAPPLHAVPPPADPPALLLAGTHAAPEAGFLSVAIILVGSRAGAVVREVVAANRSAKSSIFFVVPGTGEE
jgi:hypothetical protein